VKQGLGFINVLNGDERWGDYSGIQRRYNAQGTVWVNGMYGMANNTHSTWIAELGVSPDVSVLTPQAPVAQANVFPNPFTDRVAVEFTLSEAQQLRFELYDVNGRLVEVLLDDRVKAGVNRFSFSPHPLAAGIYMLRIVGRDGVVTEQKVIRQ
jgi:rhamnogalacturonan endolyase